MTTRCLTCAPPLLVETIRRYGVAMGRGVACLAVLAALLVVAPLGASTSRAGTAPTVYGGLGSWLDIYADDYWPNPAGVVAEAKRAGVKTLYLQTSNYRQ